jgi:hypothetical protein
MRIYLINTSGNEPMQPKYWQFSKKVVTPEETEVSLWTFPANIHWSETTESSKPQKVSPDGGKSGLSLAPRTLIEPDIADRWIQLCDVWGRGETGEDSPDPLVMALNEWIGGITSCVTRWRWWVTEPQRQEASVSLPLLDWEPFRRLVAEYVKSSAKGQVLLGDFIGVHLGHIVTPSFSSWYARGFNSVTCSVY